MILLMDSISEVCYLRIMSKLKEKKRKEKIFRGEIPPLLKKRTPFKYTRDFIESAQRVGKMIERHEQRQNEGNQE